MDIVAIDEAIESLEQEDTTVDNVKELSALYICREYLIKSNPVNISERELSEIFPYYRKYLDIKRRYQLDLTTEGEVIKGIKAVCKELTDFVDAMYSGTDMNKERLCIRQMLSALNDKYNK